LAGSDARSPVVETLTLARWCRTEWVAPGDVVPVAVGGKGLDLTQKPACAGLLSTWS
jgi:hypothetical protein